jgi:hypothetical protein
MHAKYINILINKMVRKVKIGGQRLAVYLADSECKGLCAVAALVMEVDTGLAPKALCAYERTARAAGNA